MCRKKTFFFSKIMKNPADENCENYKTAEKRAKKQQKEGKSCLKRNCPLRVKQSHFATIKKVKQNLNCLSVLSK